MVVVTAAAASSIQYHHHGRKYYLHRQRDRVVTENRNRNNNDTVATTPTPKKQISMVAKLRGQPYVPSIPQFREVGENDSPLRRMRLVAFPAASRVVAPPLSMSIEFEIQRFLNCRDGRIVCVGRYQTAFIGKQAFELCRIHICGVDANTVSTKLLGRRFVTTNAKYVHEDDEDDEGKMDFYVRLSDMMLKDDSVVQCVQSVIDGLDMTKF
jgi:hypothetical protein